MAKMVKIPDLQPAFDNASRHLYNRMRQTYSNERITMGNTANAWKELYDCYLLWDSNWNWDVVGFKDEQQELMFRLKWS